ncbi:MAG: c-type cytochrome, partial [Chthoniobacteraceae bacterium]
MIRSLLRLSTFVLFVAGSICPSAIGADSAAWIWSSKKATADEKVSVRGELTIPSAVKTATLTFTCDNSGEAFVNGKSAGKNQAWQSPTKVEIQKLLRPGKNEVRIDGRNEDGVAAVVARVEIEAADGKKATFATGADWQAAPAGTTNWKPAVVIAEYGAGPWGDVLAGGKSRGGGEGATVLAGDDIELPPGFKAELIYTVPKNEQGSWVALTVDPKGRLLASDQYGALYRIVPPPLGQPGEAVVEKLPVRIEGAHGLLYALDSLYVMVNEKGTHGLYRLRSMDGGESFGPPTLLRAIDGNGEHGPHSIIPSLDGKSLFFSCGNHTKLPEGLELSRAARTWDEDQLLPRMWDANGHAKGILAPGGYICQTDPDAKTVELYSAGFRNIFDIGMDPNGEIFTFDSDMEWDIGAPWYRPTRICHAVSGAEFGWRSGAGKWPTYYPDSLPPVLDIGPGSPTGVVMGTGAKFPAKYERAFFAADWTYGTMYAIHLIPDGASFRAEKEEFVAGKPLPLTDMVISPKDGAMYFATGGRRTQSALYRVTYTGQESTAPAPKIAPTPEATLRNQIEKLHEPGTGPEAVAKAWPYLGNPDRFIRFAARVAIERQSAEHWADRALGEKNPLAAIEGLVALARVGNKSFQPRLIEALQRFDLSTLPLPQRLAVLRAWELTFIRMGKPAPETCARLASMFDSLFPSADHFENRELVNLLVYLDSPTVVAKTVPLLSTSMDDHEDIAGETLLARNRQYAQAAEEMQASRPNRQQIAYAYALRNATQGWTPALRKAFFEWFPRTHDWKGGNSFGKFLENIRTESLANFVPEPERATLDDLSKAAPKPLIAGGVAPKGPGENYSVDEVVALAKDGLKGRNFEQGKAMYAATLCAACHHFNGEGGNIGPDLTGAGNRYTVRDLLENIVDPSKVISDQYDSQQIELKDGGTVIGRIVEEKDGNLAVMTSPLSPNDLETVATGNVKSRQTFPVSMMPPGLINTLNQDELLDLIAYLLSAGNPQNKMFAR